MINVLETSRDFTPVQQYLMTLSPEIISMQQVADDTIISVEGYMKFEDVKESSGEVSTLLAILSGTQAYVTQSATFMNSMKDIAACMNSDEFSIKKISGTTKSGRPYINCVLSI